MAIYMFESLCLLCITHGMDRYGTLGIAGMARR